MKIIILFFLIIIPQILYSEDINFIYEKSFLLTQSIEGLSNAIYCVNTDGSIITLNNGIASSPTLFAKIFRNGEFSWNRFIGVFDEFDTTKDFREFRIKKIIQDRNYNSNLYSGIERTKSIKNKTNFFYFYSTSGEVTNFFSDTTLNQLSASGNTINIYNTSENNFNFFHNRYELPFDISKQNLARFYLVKNTTFNLLKPQYLILDTFDIKQSPQLINTYNKSTKSINCLTFYVKDGLDSNLYLKISRLSTKLEKVSVDSMIIKFPENIKAPGFSQIDKNESDIIILANSLSSKEMKYLILELDISSLTYKYHYLSFDSSFSIRGFEQDKLGNWFIGGTMGYYSNKDYFSMFGICKFSSAFEKIYSKFWGLGPKNNYINGFAKFQDDEFILNGFYYDKENYVYDYVARFNTMTNNVGQNLINNPIQFKQHNNQIFIYSNEINYRVMITNLFGQVIYSQNGNQNDIALDISNFHGGVYFLTYLSNDNSKTFKFIKEQ